MSTITTPHLPAPAGFDADDWQEDVPLPYRVLFGELRGVDGLDIDRVSVQPTAVQYADGRVDDGTIHEAPKVNLGDNGLTCRQAVALAAALLAAADEADRLVTK